MGSVGANTSPREDYFNGALGERGNKSVTTVLDHIIARQAINPNYDPQKWTTEYNMNCALCTAATCLQLMGYDVEAMPRDSTWRGPDSIFDVDYSNTDNYMLGSSKFKVLGIKTPRDLKMSIRYDDNLQPDMTPKGASKVAEAIETKVAGWGNNAFGEMMVKSATSNSWHSLVVLNYNGSTLVYDSQSNEVVSNSRAELTNYLKRKTASATQLVRYDNAQVKNTPTLNKMVKRREK